MDGEEFEKSVANWLQTNGFQTHLTQGTNDRGIDVIGKKDGRTMAVQAKAYAPENSVGSPTVQKASGVLSRPEIDEVMVITTSSFTSEARAVAQNRNVGLKSVSSHEFTNSTDETDSDGGPSQLNPDDSSSRVDVSLLGVVHIEMDSGSPLTLAEDKIDGACIAMALKSKASGGRWLPIDEPTDVKITLQPQEVRHPEQISETPLAREWQTHDPSVRTNQGPRELSADIRIDDQSLYFVVIDNVSITQLKSLAIPRYSIDLTLKGQMWRDTEFNNNLEKSLTHLTETRLRL